MDKISIYQLLIRLFGNKNLSNIPFGSLADNGSGKFASINHAALRSIKNLGITHVWYTGVIAHATMEDFTSYGINLDHPQIVKGRAGSPYAIKDYYDVNPYLACKPEQRMQEFEELVNRTHEEGLKVIIDFVPNHVSRQYKSINKPIGIVDLGECDDNSVHFNNQNNFYYIPNESFIVPEGLKSPVFFDTKYEEIPAKATGNDVFSSIPSINDWFETIKLNYGVDYFNNGHKVFEPIPRTWFQMRDILMFWSEKGVNGFRCDMAEMVPVEFWNWVIPQIKSRYNQIIFIAEIYNPEQYRNYLEFGHFDYLYDKVGLYDAVRRLIEGHGNAMDITRVWQKESGDFSNRMLRFLENHDEQRVASEFFGKEPNVAYNAMMLSATLHSGPIMTYFGQELGVRAECDEGFQGNDGRTTIFDFWGISEMQGWFNKYDENDLSPSQKLIRNTYKKILNFAISTEAVIDGNFFDLQYLNDNWQSLGYDERKIYSYLRYTNNQCLLFVYNFDLENDRSFQLKLPKHLFKEENLILNFKEIFHDNEEFSIQPIDSIVIDLNVSSNQFKIFEIVVKSI